MGGKYNSLTARVRALETLRSRCEVVESPRGHSLVSTSLMTAQKCHNILDTYNQQHAHSLNGAIRAAQQAQRIDHKLAKRLLRLALAASAVRHITEVSCLSLAHELDLTLRQHPCQNIAEFELSDDDLSLAEINYCPLLDLSVAEANDCPQADALDVVTPIFLCSDEVPSDVDCSSIEHIFTLLAGMADAVFEPFVGAVILPGPFTADDVHAESLQTQRRNHHDENEKLVASVRKLCQSVEVCDDDTLRPGDLVGKTAGGILEVIRVGYGTYANEIRLLGGHERRELWSSGSWCAVAACRKVSIGTTVRIGSEISLLDGRSLVTGARAVIAAVSDEQITLRFWDIVVDISRDWWHCIDIEAG